MLSAFRHGLSTSLADIVALALGQVDEALLGDWVLGLTLLDWADARPRLPAGEDVLIPPALGLLLPFYAAKPLSFAVSADRPAQEFTLRPGSEWLAQLHAGGLDQVCQDAARRLRICGLRAVVDPARAAAMPLDGDHLAAALLLPTTERRRLRALGCAAYLPNPPGVPAQGPDTDIDDATREGVSA